MITNYFNGIGNQYTTPAINPINPFEQNPRKSQASVENEQLNTFQAIEKARKTETPETDSMAKAIAEATKSKDSSQEENKEATALSDERCKVKEIPDDILSEVKKIDAYKYVYKPGSERIDPKATSDEVHVGPMAQDLLNNPVTHDCVIEENGILKVDTQRLALTTFAILTELARRVN